jgi:transposase
MQKEAEIIAELREENRYLKQELASLKSLFWGKKSERSIVPDTQATLSFGEDIVIANPSPEKKKEKVENTPEPGSKAPVRKPIPDHIPRVDVVLEPENVDLSKYEKIRDEVTEILDYVKSKIVVKRIIRPIYRLIENNGEPNLICANLPAQPVSKSNASASLVAHILICKYADHTPLHRQLKQFLREGIDLAESTVNGWVHKHIKILEPLYELAKKMVQNGHYIMADETPMPVLSADKIGSTHKGYFWVY